MAKLPYTFTICPDGPEPQKFTVSCPQMGRLLKASPNGDLTIDERRHGYWDSWSGRSVQLVPIEDQIAAVVKDEHETR